MKIKKKELNVVQGEKIKQLLKDNGLTVEDVYGQLGYSGKDGLYAVLDGKNAFPYEKIVALKENIFPWINLNWFMMNDGIDRNKIEVRREYKGGSYEHQLNSKMNKIRELDEIAEKQEQRIKLLDQLERLKAEEEALKKKQNI